MGGPTFLTAALVLFIAVVLHAGGQSARSTPPRSASSRAALPPVLQTCPMHPDVVEEQPGTCPLCKMKLVPVRLESVWSCPLHAAVVRQDKGRCPICNRELVQMTMALTWTCKGRADIDVIEPGRCPDGSPMIAKRTLRPHGNHNPQHGGQFFMAPDNTHHLEGTLPSARLFRVFVYDDYARPLSRARMQEVTGFVESKGRAIPLTASLAGSYLDGRLDAGALPTQLTAKLRIKKGGPEYRFDFAFPATTKDPGLAPAPTAPSAKPTAQSPITNQESPIDPALIQVPIPSTVPEMLTQLRTRTTQVKDLIDRGNLAAVFVPAFQARDLAIAFESRLPQLSAAARDVAAPAIARLVRIAWQLDAAGDAGNREELLRAYPGFAAAADDIATAFRNVR